MGPLLLFTGLEVLRRVEALAEGLLSMGEKQEPGPALQRGLELAQQLLAVRPGWPDARLLRGSLFALQAALPSAAPGQKQVWRGQAREELSSAWTSKAF